MYIIHIVGMVLCVGKEFYVIQILELFYVEIIIFPVIFDGNVKIKQVTHRKKQSGRSGKNSMRSALGESLGKRKDTPGRSWV